MHPREHALDDPERRAAILAETGEFLTYGALENIANRGAHFFRSLGIVAGEAVAILLPNTLRYFEVYWAAQRAGLYITPISTKLTADEVAYILNDCGAKLLVTSGEMPVLPALLGEARAACPKLDTILTTDAGFEGLADWHEAIAPFSVTPISDESAGFHMVYSSGTTGRPKGVRVPLTGGPATEPHMLAARHQDRYGVAPHSILLTPAPIYHTAPLVFSTTCHRLGGTLVLLRKFTPEGALDAIQKYQVTYTQMVPTMFLRMLRLPDAERESYDLSSLTHVIHSAAPCPVEVKHAVLDWFGPIIYEYYGGSEGNGSTFITPQEWLRKPGSVGRADWGIIHICNEEGDELPVGEQGIVYFEGGWKFEYLNDKAKSAEARNAKHPGWTTLGDIGYLDADGYLFLTDRKSFMIISGGVNIYPQETENVLIFHPKVADVAVIGVPNDEMGEEVKAVVQPCNWEDAGPQLEAELMQFCRERLSHIKCPRSIDFEPALPRHETGKLYKRAIRDRYWQDKDKRIA